MRVFLTGGSGFIGTNLVEEMLRRGWEVRNFDAAEPQNAHHKGIWQRGDLLDLKDLEEQIADFQPQAAIHLAARADCDENTTVEDGYRANTDGTRNFLSAIRSFPVVQRAIIVSSQYVSGPDRLPTHDTDYFPHTVYGQSKVITEQLTRSAGLPCTWTIVRPTNVWGPWHWRYPNEFWKIAAKGLYFHPGGAPVRRCYAYVGNVVWQMLRVLELPAAVVSKRTFYVGDEVDDIYNWANGFCLALADRPAPKIPRSILRGIACGGDIVTAVTGKNFYLTSSRFRSMTSDYPTPLEETFRVLGKGPFSLEQGIRKTVEWLRESKGWHIPQTSRKERSTSGT